MTADVYITQETRDAIFLKAFSRAQQSIPGSSGSQELNCTNSSVYTLKSNHNCAGTGGAGANLRGERSSEGGDGTLLSNFPELV